MTTKIEWTDETWNPVTGCTKVSAGCKNCYAEKMAKRLKDMRQVKYKDGFKVRIHESSLDEPFRWKKPRRVFVCSMGDLFHDDVPDDFRDKVFAVMALAKQHTFIVLTKRPERMSEYMKTADWGHRANTVTDSYIRRLDNDLYFNGEIVPPLPNVHLGVSVEDQETADERIPHLLQTPAAKRFISIEPMLGPVNLSIIPCSINGDGDVKCAPADLDGVILGCESGPGARAMYTEWARKVRNDCKAAGVPFFLKQMKIKGKLVKMPELDGVQHKELP